MRNIFLLALNTLKRTFRKKSNIIIFLALPVVTILISILINSNSGNISVNVGVNNQDKTIMAQDLINFIKKGGNYKVTSIGEKDINDKITKGDVDSVLVIPAGFADGIYNYHPKPVKIISIKGQDATAFIKNCANFYIGDLLDISKASGGRKDTFDLIYSNYKKGKVTLTANKIKDTKQSKDITIQSLGFLIALIMLGSSLTSNLILEEKRDRTYYRICTAPVNSRTYIAGNVLANLTITSLQIIISLLIATQVMHIKTYVPFIDLLLITMFFGIVAVGFGMVIVAFAADTMQSSTLSSIILNTTCMLGGCFWPISVMPKTMQKISDFMPQKWALEAIRKIQTGSSLSDVSINIAITLAFAAALFLIAIFKFSKDDSVKNFV